MRFLIQHTHTLHAKVTIPLACWLSNQGHEVVFRLKKDRWHRFSSRYIQTHPTHVSIIDREALRYVAQIIGYAMDWQEVESRIDVSSSIRERTFDAVISSTKELDELRQLQERMALAAFAIGYQHLPVLLNVGGKFHGMDPEATSSLLLASNPFTQMHGFPALLNGCDVRLNGFLYLDRVYAQRSPVAAQRPWALIFHPGGYRGIVSEPGENRTACLVKQRALLERVCLPLLQVGLRPVVKVHPLRAQYHDLVDIQRLISDLEREQRINPGTIVCLAPEASYSEYARNSQYILTYGSSAVYELWSAGLTQVMVCHFEGKSRSQKFRMFPTITMDTYSDYLSFLKTKQPLQLDPFTQSIADSYASLTTGQATATAGKCLIETLSRQRREKTFSTISRSNGKARPTDIGQLTLTLLFTGGVSLRTWDRIGSLSREIESYQRLASSIGRVNFLTYGADEDLEYLKRLHPIHVLPVSWHRWKERTVEHIVRNHHKALSETHVIKTNQLHGADIAAILKRRLGIPWISRCGYIYSRTAALDGVSRQRLQEIQDAERRGLEGADLIVVATEAHREWMIHHHGMDPERLRVIPNAVNTERFCPQPGVKKCYDLIYIGRSSPDKNLALLLESIRLLSQRQFSVRTLFIGDCASDRTLSCMAQGLDVQFRLNLPNEELPRYLAQAKAFVLPSRYEGHSKVLLEAMSCALPCIGTDVPGIREEILHGTTGILCEPSPESLADAIHRVLTDETLQQHLGTQGRQRVLERYTIERVLELELDTLRELISYGSV